MMLFQGLVNQSESDPTRRCTMVIALIRSSADQKTTEIGMVEEKRVIGSKDTPELATSITTIAPRVSNAASFMVSPPQECATSSECHQYHNTSYRCIDNACVIAEEPIFDDSVPIDLAAILPEDTYTSWDGKRTFSRANWEKSEPAEKLLIIWSYTPAITDVIKWDRLLFECEPFYGPRVLDFFMATYSNPFDVVLYPARGVTTQLYQEFFEQVAHDDWVLLPYEGRRTALTFAMSNKDNNASDACNQFFLVWGCGRWLSNKAQYRSREKGFLTLEYFNDEWMTQGNDTCLIKRTEE
ncbi:unnamed protein product, partial [Mesorhabditis spiculigera]